MKRDPSLQGIEEWTGHRQPAGGDEPPSKLSILGLAVVVIVILACAASMGCAMKGSSSSGNSVSITINILTP